MLNMAVILEIGLTFKHMMIVFQPHCQEISLNIILIMLCTAACSSWLAEDHRPPPTLVFIELQWLFIAR
jgi:hypothetical protein